MNLDNMLVETPYTALKITLINLPPHKRAAALARALDWAGDDIYNLMIDALIDSNFHTEALALQKAWNLIKVAA